ncbi:MAG: type 4a pilus biogenesis protein PilO [Desulfotalea sp.]
MNINYSAISTFLDDKFIPLPKNGKIGIAIGFILLPVLVYGYFFELPARGQITQLEQQRDTATTNVSTAKKQASRLKEFEEEAKKSEIDFNIAAAKLPKEKEVPQLLKDISALGINSGLDFQSFKPLAERPKGDFYSDIPISIKVRGPYHNVGFFFDQINKLDRIVSVSNVQMGSPIRDEGEMLLSSSCTLVTYRFTNKKLAPKGKK